MLVLPVHVNAAFSARVTNRPIIVFSQLSRKIRLSQSLIKFLRLEMPTWSPAYPFAIANLLKLFRFANHKAFFFA